METDRDVRVRVQKISLDLQLARRGPVVVTLDDGDVVALAGMEALDEVLTPADVAITKDWLEDIGALPPEIFDDRARTIGGAIFANDLLDCKVSLLGQHADDVLCDERLMVVGGRQNADPDTHATAPRVSGSARLMAAPLATENATSWAIRSMSCGETAVPVGSTKTCCASRSVTGSSSPACGKYER